MGGGFFTAEDPGKPSLWKGEVSKRSKTRQAVCAEKTARGWIRLREAGDSRGARPPLSVSAGAVPAAAGDLAPGPMASPAGISGHDGARAQLLSHLRRLDPWQLEDFKLGLQCPELLPAGARRIPWADLRAAGPADLLCLLEERYPGRRTWEAALRVFEDLRLSSLCERLRAELHGERAAGALPGVCGVLPDCGSPLSGSLPDGLWESGARARERVVMERKHQEGTESSALLLDSFRFKNLHFLLILGCAPSSLLRPGFL